MRSAPRFLALSAAAALACGDVSMIAVTTPPTVEINSPGSSQQFATGETVTFAGVVEDQQDKPDQLTATWKSDLDGILDEGVPDSDGRVQFSTINLSPGTHLVTLQAIDSDGEVGEDNVAVTLTRENHAPVVEIEYPESGDSFLVGSSIAFSAVVEDEDEEDAPELMEVLWEDEAGNELGNDPPDDSGFLSLNLSTLTVGDHTVTVTVKDTQGANDYDFVYITILEENTAPSAVITDPTSNERLLEGSVSFAGSVQDAEDQNQLSSMGVEWVWVHDDGSEDLLDNSPASTSGLLSFATDLSPGPYDVELRVMDTGGLQSYDAVSFTVVDEDDWDFDADGFTVNEGDCDDNDATTYPGASELCDELDNDCDGEINNGLGDGTGSGVTDLGSMNGSTYCICEAAYFYGSADSQTMSGTIHSPDDYDIFAFETEDEWYDCLDNEGYGIQITLSSIPSGNDYVLELYSYEAGAIVGSSDNGGNATETVDYSGTCSPDDGGDFEVYVYPNPKSGYSCADSYSLQIEVY